MSRYVTPVAMFVKLITLKESGLVSSVLDQQNVNVLSVYYDIGGDHDPDHETQDMFVSTSQTPDVVTATTIDIVRIVEVDVLCWDRLEIDDEEDDEATVPAEVPAELVTGFQTKDGSIWITKTTDSTLGDYFDGSGYM